MKKLLLFMAAVLALGVTARAANGDEFTVDKLKYKVISEVDKSASLIGYTDRLTGELVIPRMVRGYMVASIGGKALQECYGLTSVTIPNTVTSIGMMAFKECDGLTSVEIPHSVTSIGSFAFADCSFLTSIAIPNSVTSIDDSTFKSCSSLTSVTIPNSVAEIGKNAFANCSSLTSVTIPNSVAKIGDGAFYKCSSLISVNIPNLVTKISDLIFFDCSSLTSVTIPNSVAKIGNYAFANCTSLTSVTIPNSVVIIGNYAFARCLEATFYCYALIPPAVAGDAFKYNARNSILHVVKGSDAAYKVADIWKDFYIVADLEEQSGIDAITAEGGDAPAEYFTLSGVRISGEALTPGLYIKRQSGKASKVLVE